MKTLSLVLLLQGAMLPATAAVTIDCTPGAFRSHLLETGIPEDGCLIVKGDINVVDMIEIAGLEGMSVDLSDCKVAAFTSPKSYLYDRHSFAADEIPDYAFAGSGIQSIVLPGSVISIGDGAFLGSKIESITISEGTRSVGDYALRDCESLKKVNMPKTLKEIGKECFAGCTSLESLDFSATTLKEIPERMVAGCDALISIIWPETVSHISTLALADSKVMSISLTKNVTAAPFALAHTSLQYPHIPLIAPAEAKGILLNSPNVKGMDYKWSVVPAAAFAGAPGANIYGYTTEAAEVGSYAFYGNIAESVTFAESITSLGKEVFGNMPLKQINAFALRDRVPAVTAETFNGHKLSEITLIVHKDYVKQWEAADVWREFNIVPHSSGVNTLEAESFSMHLHEGVLRLSASQDITDVIVADEAGRILATAQPGSPEASVSVSDAGSRVIIVTTRFADFSSRTDKILR